MDIKNCKVCKKIFQPVGRQVICTNCLRIEAEEFQRVRDYLKKNRGSDINMVSEETEVSTKKILKYLREGKIEVSDNDNITLKCKRCDKPIKSGKFCKNCIADITQTMNEPIKKGNNEENGSIGMQTKRKQ